VSKITNYLKKDKMEKEVVFTRKKKDSDKTVNVNLQVLSTLVARAQLNATLGNQYEGDRNLYTTLGYKNTLTWNDYYDRYDRQDIAKAVIDRPANITWQGGLSLIEVNDAKDTKFEKAWEEISGRLGLIDKFIRVDKLCGIGEYAVLLLGFDDVKQNEDFKKKISGKKLNLLYVKPFSYNNAKITSYETNVNNPRYGMPLIYTLSTADAESKVMSEVQVHYTRVIHVIEDVMESDIFGVPRLKAIFNRLYDLEKIVGGDAEMFWRGARPGYAGKLDKDYMMTDDVKDALLEQVDEYEHNLRRILINEGIDLTALAQQIADPKNHVDIQIQMISAVTGIPKRILTGSERGELSSSQDSVEWNNYVTSRRLLHAEPHIIKLFIDKCIEYGILPKPKETYKIQWMDLSAISEKDRVDIGQKRATAIKEYMSMPLSELIIPVSAFMEYCLGLSQDQIEYIKTLKAADETSEDAELHKAMLEMTKIDNKFKSEEPTTPEEE